MNILDENIPDDQQQFLRNWGIRSRKIGRDIGRKGIQDEEIIPFLHQLSRPTLITRDLGFYNRRFCHRNYGIVCLDIQEDEVANFTRRILHHATFNTQAKRMGRVIRASDLGIRVWQLSSQDEEWLSWT